MKHTVDHAIKQAVKKGYTGSTDKYFMAGHSLGGVCASNFTEAYEDHITANIVYGSYVTD
jgi:alpha-beta hydrolase superfamily lysophospholipase